MAEELIKPIEKIQPLQASEKTGVETVPVRPESGAEMKASETEKGKAAPEIRLAETGASSIVSVANSRQRLKEEERAIENILEKDLREIYAGMAPEKQREFKAKGEETAMEINVLLHKTKVRVGKIINLIVKWLSIIPGINRFFIEQDAKIRADEIIKMKRGL